MVKTRRQAAGSAPVALEPPSVGGQSDPTASEVQTPAPPAPVTGPLRPSTTRPDVEAAREAARKSGAVLPASHFLKPMSLEDIQAKLSK